MAAQTCILCLKQTKKLIIVAERKFEMARIIRAMTSDGAVRAAVIDSRDIVDRSIDIHHTMPTASAALGRTLTAASLMGCLMPEKDDLITISFRGDGDGGRVLASADYLGNVRGYIQNPLSDPPRRPDGKLNVAACVGRGNLCVLRDTGGAEPYSGTSPIVSGEIGDDIAYYYAMSEQLPTVCALGVLVGQDRSCLAAGGALVQLLPFADEEIVSLLERNAQQLRSVTSVLPEHGPEGLLEILLKDMPYDIFDEMQPEYKCECSRVKTDRALIALGRQELQELIDDPTPTELKCQFCDKTYNYTKEELKKLLEESTKA